MWIGKHAWIGKDPLLTLIFPWFWIKIGWTKRMLFSERNGYVPLLKLGAIFISMSWKGNTS